MDCTDDDPSTHGALPDLDALVAGTLALMTAWADPCPKARLPLPDLRRVLARKVVSNLFFLQHHPQARPALRQAMANVHAHWVGLAHAPAGPLPAPLEDARSASLH